jgi:hypothetical protein
MSEGALKYYGLEGAGAVGAAGGRMLTEDSGPWAEVGGALLGDLAVRQLPTALRRSVRAINSSLRVHVKDIGPLERELQEEFIDVLQREGGWEKMMADPKKRHIVHEAAARLQRAAGGREASGRAVEYMEALEEIAQKNGIELDSFSMGAVTDNAGLRGVEQEALAHSPRLADHLKQLREPSSKAVRTKMVELGPPIDADDMDVLRSVVRQDIEQRLAAQRAELEPLYEGAEASLGAHGRPENAQLSKIRNSQEYADEIQRVYEESRDLVVGTLYKKVARLQAATPNLRFGVSGSKGALADMETKVFEAGEIDLPSDLIQIMRDWPSSGTTFGRLREMQKKLGKRAADAEKAGDHDLALHIRELQDGVKLDLEKWEIWEAGEVVRRWDDKPAAGARAMPGELNQVDLPFERELELFDAETARIKELTPEAQMKYPVRVRPKPKDVYEAARAKPGTLEGPIEGAMAPGPDNVLAYADDVSRENLGDALNEANAAMREHSLVFANTIVTGKKIISKARQRNPVPHSEQLALYLNPGKNYTERLQDLVARIGDDPEVLKNVEDYLIADAYQSSVASKFNPDGSNTIEMNRAALDKWRKANSQALDAFPEVRASIESGEEFLDRARKLGASPDWRQGIQNTKTLEKFFKDPEIFWSDLTSKGSDKAARDSQVIFDAILNSGDELARKGLQESFWQHMIVEQISKYGAEFGTPEVTLSAVRGVLGDPRMVKIIEELFPAGHIENLQELAKLQRGILETDKLPGKVQPANIDPAAVQFEKLATKGSIFSVILGPIRRGAKMTKTAREFARKMDNLKVGAAMGAAVEDPPLLKMMLKLDPSDELIRKIEWRLSANLPTVFPRAKGAEEKREKDEADRQRRLELQNANRAITAPPTRPAGPTGFPGPLF